MSERISISEVQCSVRGGFFKKSRKLATKRAPVHVVCCAECGLIAEFDAVREAVRNQAKIHYSKGAHRNATIARVPVAHARPPVTQDKVFGSYNSKQAYTVRLQIAVAGGSLSQGFEMEIPVYTLSAALMLTVFACITEFERKLIRERTGTGRVDAMRRGVRFVRPASLSTDPAALAKRVPRRGYLTFSLGTVLP